MSSGSRRRRYWQANPASPLNKHLLTLHEALHVAVEEALGYQWTAIVVRSRTGYVRDTIRPGTLIPTWHHAAIHLAPALIDDMSDGDEEVMAPVPHRTRGYAWGWLQKNREALMERANEIAAACGSPPGQLINRDGKLIWRGRR